ncbi:MAG: substrate-binding periplasmic protein [Planctomycetota bacterium]|jgi:polar amino acid transport system substrate-binding protein
MTTKPIRWWWHLGVAWLGLCIMLWLYFTGVPSLRRVIFSNLPIALTPLLLGVAWLVVVAPYMESGMQHFSDRATARRRWKLCRTFAWTPTVIFALLGVNAIVLKAVGVDHFGWYDHGYEWYAGAAFVFSIFYGRMMARRLERRIRTAAWMAKSCFRCNYRLEGIASERCPECGEPIVRLAALALAACLALGAVGCSSAETVRVATDAVFPPFHYVDEQGALAGHDVEMARAAVERTGRRAEIVRGESFAELYTGLESGKYDVIAATTGITAERQKRYGFTRPYFLTCLCVMVRTDSAHLRPDDLRGHRIAASRGTTSVPAAERIADAIVVEMPSAADMLAALRSGDVDAVVVDEFEAVEWSAEDADFRVLREPAALESYGLVLRLDDVTLRRDLDLAITAMSSNGMLTEMRRRHGLERPPDWPVDVPEME